MKGKKLQRFAELNEMDHVIQLTDWNPEEDVALKGNWAKDHFKNDKPITLELACGKGEYTIGMAERRTDMNFIGVDIKGARIWRGAKTAAQNEMKNVGFLRIEIEHINKYFAPGEVENIWITFPDPFLKDRKQDKRLTSPRFLKLYKNILKEGGFINLKTDSPELYEYSLEVLDELNIPVDYSKDGIYDGPLENDLLEIKTYYEGKHLEIGRTIKYLRFSLDGIENFG